VQAYSDSKLFDVALAFAVARHWPNVLSNALEPGRVSTKMGGAGAPDDLSRGPVTQAWLAAGTDPSTKVSGAYFYHQEPHEVHPAAHDVRFQEALLAYCASLCGVALPHAEASRALSDDSLSE
jgi:NAD(P)-dependent dehydrogenase (short-subunit alcohol dehydrogenase family)